MPAVRSSTSSLTDMDYERERRTVGQAAVEASDSDSEGRSSKSEELSVAQSQRVPPHEAVFVLQGNTALAQAELCATLLFKLMPQAAAPQEQRDVQTALSEAIAGTQKTIADYVNMVSEREE